MAQNLNLLLYIRDRETSSFGTNERELAYKLVQKLAQKLTQKLAQNISTKVSTIN